MFVTAARNRRALRAEALEQNRWPENLRWYVLMLAIVTIFVAVIAKALAARPAVLR